MNKRGNDHISRYIMHAFGQSMATARIPRKKPGELAVVTTARIVLSVQYEGKFAFMPLTPVDIRADSAEWYGYVDGIPPSQSPTMLDVVTQAHEFIYGDNFDARTCRTVLDVDDDKGILRTMLGYSGIYTCFCINGQYAYDSDSEYTTMGYRGLMLRETPVYDLDVIEIFGFEKSFGKDLYTYFMAPDGSWTRKVEAAPGEPITVRHEGFLFVFGGPYTPEDRVAHHMIDPIRQSQIAIVDTRTYQLHDIEGAVTDDNGFVTFSIDEPGEYYVTAHRGNTKRRKTNISLPWLPVIVR